jgi:hypothetical protein
MGPKMREGVVFNEFNDTWPRIFISVKNASPFQ